MLCYTNKGLLSTRVGGWVGGWSLSSFFVFFLTCIGPKVLLPLIIVPYFFLKTCQLECDIFYV